MNICFSSLFRLFAPLLAAALLFCACAPAQSNSGGGTTSADTVAEAEAPTPAETGGNFLLECTVNVASDGIFGVTFGAATDGGSYRLIGNGKTDSVSLVKAGGGMPQSLAKRNCDIKYNIDIPIRIIFCNGVATIYFNENPADEAPYPKFELALGDFVASDIATDGGGAATFSAITVTGYRAPDESETYLNPICDGADPDVLYYDGIYYMYNRVNDGYNVFRVRTSTDLVTWTDGKIVFVHSTEFTTHKYMSPNVFYYDGLFYMLFAARGTDEKTHIYYVSAKTPDGDFALGGEPTMLHDGVSEIGGHPFFDDDGKIYLSLVRFGGGNFVWMEEVTVGKGKITPVADTLTLAISPTETYEIDEHGKISEGGVIIKHNGLYYMMYASGHYLGHYGEAYAVAENVLGPYVKYEYNDFLTYNRDVDGCGDAVFVRSPGGELFIMYHCHFSTDAVEPRQTCIDRVKFVKNPDGGVDILTVCGPTTTPQRKPE